MLTSLGYRVEEAGNGREALDALGESDFDVALMDVQMPEMNGLEAARAIRAVEAGTRRHVPVIALTAIAMRGDREDCLEAGMDDYLTKPIDLRALVDALARAQSDAKAISRAA